MLRHAIFGAPAPPPLPKPPDRVTFAQLRTAAPFDAKVFRAVGRWRGSISQPAEVYTAPEVVARPHATLHEHDSDPSIVQPRRDDWLAAINADRAGLQAC